MRNIFKHGDKSVTKPIDPTSFLYAESVKSTGCIDIKDDAFITHDKRVFASYEYSYETPYGMDRQIDRANDKATTLLVNSLECDFKITYMSEVKNSLDDNIKYYEEVLENTADEKRRDLIMRHLDVMRFYNDERSIKQMIEIEKKACDVLANTAYAMQLKRLNNDELIASMRTRNNRME